MQRDITKEMYEKRYTNQKYEESVLFSTFKNVTDNIIKEVKKDMIEKIEVFKNSFSIVGRTPNLSDIESLIKLLKEDIL